MDDKQQGLAQTIAATRAEFPDDSPQCARFFGAALYYERQGNDEKADGYLVRALEFEASGK